MGSRLVAGVIAVACLLAAPVAASAQDGSARQRQLAQQIMDETGMTANLDSMMKDMFDRMMPASVKPMGPAAEARAKGMADSMTAAMIRVKPKIMQASIDAYARTFSEEELSGILAFYRTPVGRSMASKMPQLMRNITDATIQIMPDVQATMAAEMCAREACSDALKAMAAKAKP